MGCAMTGMTIALLLFAGMLLLMALRVPIAMAMMVPGVVGYVAISGWPSLLNALKGLAFARLANYDLTVIPLFLLMGAFASQGGLSRSLFHAANAVIGHLRGGLAMAAVLACARSARSAARRSPPPPRWPRSPCRRCAR